MQYSTHTVQVQSTMSQGRITENTPLNTMYWFGMSRLHLGVISECDLQLFYMI